MKRIEKRENKGYEIQWYDDNGNNSHVTQCDNVGELAQVLAHSCWGCGMPGGSLSPTIWYNGTPWCNTEYSEVK